MADNNATSPPLAALESSVPTAPPQPQVRLAADAEDEDIDALIDDLKSQDDEDVEEEEEQQSSGAVPEELLQTDTRTGLTEAEVVARRRKYCPDELEQTENLILKFLRRFIQPKMLFSVGIAAYLQEWVDLGVICAVLLLDATVGFVQAYQSASIVSELKKTLALKTIVCRDGILQEIVSSDLVPGDIIHLERETILPADGRVVVADTELLVDQSSITGDTLAVRKEEGDMCFQSTTVLRGKALIVATATGQNTFVSRAAALIPQDSASFDVAPYVRVLNSIGSTLLVLVFLTLCVVWVSSYYRSTDITTILRFSLSVTLVGIPVGLPAVVTTTLAVGAANLAKRKVIVQHLKAIECLASVEVLCSDKTGTLTQNKLSLAKPFTVNGVDPNDLMLTACLTTIRKRYDMEPIDKALLKTLYLYPPVKSALTKYRVLDYQPFDPYYKETRSTVISPQGERIACVKGAPMAILNLVAAHTSIPKEIEDAYKDKLAELAVQGFRAFGVCRRQGENAWELLGLIPCLDPLRYDTHRYVKEAKDIGLAIKMITGDAVGIARETSRQLGFGTNVYNAERLGLGGKGDGDMSGSDVYDFIERANGFAEVVPSQRYSIVQILQNRGYLVAVTGDGANDGPSLKKADLGLAVEGASDAARAAADVVFLGPGLRDIIDAIKVSRQVFQRIYAYAVYRIALVLHMDIFLGLWIAVFNRTLNLDLVIFVAIFADVTTLAIAYDWAPYSQTPYKWNLPKLWGISVLLGVILAVGTWITLTTILVGGKDGGIVQNYGNIDTIIFLQICLTESWLIFITRTKGPFWTSIPSRQLVGAVFLVDLFATLFCLFGWFEDGHTHIVAVIRIWIFSFGVFCAMAGFYYFAEGSAAFDNIMHGKSARRSPSQRWLEDFVVSLQRVSTQHEKSQ